MECVNKLPGCQEFNKFIGSPSEKDLWIAILLPEGGSGPKERESEVRPEPLLNSPRYNRESCCSSPPQLANNSFRGEIGAKL